MVIDHVVLYILRSDTEEVILKTPLKHRIQEKREQQLIQMGAGLHAPTPIER